MITPTLKQPVNYVPRDILVSRTKRRHNQEEQDVPVKCARRDPEAESRRRSILAPMQFTHPDVDPSVPLEDGEHPIRGKEAGANTLQKMTRQAILSQKLVMYLDRDEEDDGEKAVPPRPYTSRKKEKDPVRSQPQTLRGREVCLEDYTKVIVSTVPKEDDVKLELMLNDPEFDYLK